MMNIKFFANLREITKSPETALQLENARIKEVLEALIVLYGEPFRNAVFDARGELYVKILINGRNIDYLEGIESKAAENDTIYLFPPIAGGSCAEL